MLKSLIISKVIEEVADRVNLPSKTAKASAMGGVAAGVVATSMTTQGMETLEGQITAVVGAVISLLLFLWRERD